MQAASTNQIADISHFNDSIKGHVKGEDEIWSAIERSGLDKCWCAVQLTVFAYGSTKLLLPIIFKSKRLGGTALKIKCVNNVPGDTLL